MTTVVALGGNALAGPGGHATVEDELARLRVACASLAPVVRAGPVVITHGNGPQVGQMLLRHERAAEEVPPHPLYLLVAETQAELGALIAAALGPVADRPVACLLTHVLVDEDDPAFSEPTKPIGPAYAEAEARELERRHGWALVAEDGRGWRRVVASPEPREVVELEAVRALLTAGTIAVACGGGGIPVVRSGGELRGVDAVIDKDRASALLASGLDAERLLIVTDVGAVYRGFGSPGQTEIRSLTSAQAEELAPELAAGSMRPKLEACVSFVRATGGDALVTSVAELEAALAGSAGTRIVP